MPSRRFVVKRLETKGGKKIKAPSPAAGFARDDLSPTSWGERWGGVGPTTKAEEPATQHLSAAVRGRGRRAKLAG